ncbi:hypothetical protein [Acidovorax sp. Root219]|uniref:hypothetical protein n=1 Tax=Acidovorax sp. Root219 TaxID=1736493 RepID=UPI0012F9456F|nr:hypothetical protein [Acidovorax sp. Root219]
MTHLMRSALLMLTLLFGHSIAWAEAEGPPACFLGLWKSHEALTLEDMRKHPDVSDKAKTLFENNFFGKLVVIFGPRNHGSYFEDETDAQPLQFNAYRIKSRGPDWMVLTRQLLGEDVDTKLGCEGERYYAIITRWEFKEYFVRVP